MAWNGWGTDGLCIAMGSGAWVILVVVVAIAGVMMFRAGRKRKVADARPDAAPPAAAGDPRPPSAADFPSYENATEFAGQPVADFDPSEGIVEPGRVAYRLRIDWEEQEKNVQFLDKLSAYLADAGSAATTGLVIGNWGTVHDGDGAAPIVEALAAARGKLPKLTALFIGDIVSEENEISWIQQTDLSPLWQAYPGLEHLRVRGGNNLSLGRIRLGKLRSLIVETGGLPASVLREIAEAEMPELEHLELWLGEESYGWDGTIADVVPLLSGGRFPKLRYLGLRDSTITDEIAMAVASAPILEQIEVLDLSLGTLGDEGAAALAASPGVAKLKRLDIHHHYVSDEQVAALRRLGIELNAGDPQESDGSDDRYIAVSE